LVDASRLVLTDSGGIQEETTILGVPCLTLRENTERPVTVTHGTNQVVGTEPARILEAWRQLQGRSGEVATPPLWDGRAAERIADVLSKFAAARLDQGSSANAFTP
jgi:UDP-N-acetylglucosamine 2-epimerase (non-hydrolysing)